MTAEMVTGRAGRLSAAAGGHVHYEALMCSERRCLLDVEVPFLSSGLGPPEVVCRCGHVVPKGRREWASLEWPGQARFAISTGIVLVGVGFVSGVSVQGMRHFLQHGPRATRMRVNKGDFVPGIVVGVALVLAVQAWRIARSKARTGGAGEVPPRVSAWTSPDVAVGFKLFALAWLPVLLGYGASWLIH